LTGRLIAADTGTDWRLIWAAILERIGDVLSQVAQNLLQHKVRPGYNSGDHSTPGAFSPIEHPLPVACGRIYPNFQSFKQLQSPLFDRERLYYQLPLIAP
jgi:hypothetical protein